MTDTMLRPTILSSFGEDTARVRRSDSITSHEAADTNDTTRSIGLVLQILTEQGPQADHEIEVWAALHYGAQFTAQRLRTARKALVKKNLVEATGIYRLTATNRRANVWAVVCS